MSIGFTTSLPKMTVMLRCWDFLLPRVSPACTRLLRVIRVTRFYSKTKTFMKWNFILMAFISGKVDLKGPRNRTTNTMNSWVFSRRLPLGIVLIRRMMGRRWQESEKVEEWQPVKAPGLTQTNSAQLDPTEAFQGFFLLVPHRVLASSQIIQLVMPSCCGFILSA